MRNCPIIAVARIIEVCGQLHDLGETHRAASDNPLEPFVVTLRIGEVLEGEIREKQIEYTHYSRFSPIIAGPPQGPAGAEGSVGIYFLKGNAEEGYRSCVDAYRPDWRTSAHVEFEFRCGTGISLRPYLRKMGAAFADVLEPEKPHSCGADEQEK